MGDMQKSINKNKKTTCLCHLCTSVKKEKLKPMARIILRMLTPKPKMMELYNLLKN